MWHGPSRKASIPFFSRLRQLQGGKIEINLSHWPAHLPIGRQLATRAALGSHVPEGVYVQRGGKERTADPELGIQPTGILID